MHGYLNRRERSGQGKLHRMGSVPGFTLQGGETKGNKGVGGRWNRMCLLKPLYLVTNTNIRKRVTFIMKNIIFKGRIKWVSEINQNQGIKGHRNSLTLMSSSHCRLTVSASLTTQWNMVTYSSQAYIVLVKGVLIIYCNITSYLNP